LQRKLAKVREIDLKIQDGSVGELGLLEAYREAGIDRVQVPTTMPYSPLWKSASIRGLGRASVVEVGLGGNELAFNISKLVGAPSRERCASILLVSWGAFAIHPQEEVLQLKELCEKYGAWLHVDGGY